jgi:hypothetical protein
MSRSQIGIGRWVHIYNGQRRFPIWYSHGVLVICVIKWKNCNNIIFFFKKTVRKTVFILSLPASWLCVSTSREREECYYDYEYRINIKYVTQNVFEFCMEKMLDTNTDSLELQAKYFARPTSSKARCGGGWW